MIFEVRVTLKDQKDSKGESLLAEIKKTLNIHSIDKIKTAKVYRLENIKKDEIKKFVVVALYEEIDQIATFNKPIFPKSAKIIEVAYKPGVMNPEVASILKVAKDLNIKLDACDSSWEYAFFGKVSSTQIQNIIHRLLVNVTVETVITKPPKTLKITGTPQKVQKVPIRKSSDKKLMELSRDKLFLNLEEMKVIQNYFIKINRDPVDCEVEILAQTWSEHCVHKTFRANLTIDGKQKEPLITRIKRTAKNNPKLIVSAFVDNSGVIDFYEGWAIAGKVETHNSPSAIEPYGGAMTGSGGVFRDILGTGQGAKPIVSTDIFCFAPPNLSRQQLPPGCLPPQYLLRKVVAGVRDYGNRVGIPTNNGSIHFHPDFRAKPTVAVGSFGLIKKSKAKKGEPKSGDLIITLGGKTGRDGIHGATFSSGEMTAKTTTVSGSAVQIGNAIEGKRVIDLVLSLSQKGLIRAVTDCGAGGYSSAIGEMGRITGAEVHLEKVPLKYANLAPWEIFLSESQERMVIAINPRDLKVVENESKILNVESTVIGRFTNTKKLKVYYHKNLVCDLPMDFLHDGLPQRHMIGKTSKIKIKEKLPSQPKDLSIIWQKIMAHGNVCSKEPIVRMYDHNVQGTAALHPFSGENFEGPNDGAIIRPILSKPYGMVVAHGLNPTLNIIDPYWGSIWATLEALSNYVSVGGDIKDAALVDNFIWPFPDEESLADLDKSTDAACEVANLLNMPFVSGKDSLSSTYRFPDGKILKIPPVLLISVFGKIPDATKTTSSDFKKIGSTLVLVGKPDFKNLGGSTYFDSTSSKSQKIAKPDLLSVNKVFSIITSGIRLSLIKSCHDISEGGMAAALAEMCFGAGFGAQISIKSFKTRDDYILFSETPGTFLVEVESTKVANKLFAKTPHTILGRTIKSNEIIVSGSKTTKVNLEKLKKSWQKPMKEVFNG
jgi:phosphoribosylformylglycinamidine synthase